MQYVYKYLLVIVMTMIVFACSSQGQQENQKNTSASESEVIYGEDGLEYFTSSTGKRIPKAEKGVTVVNQTGWSNDQMTFQQDYCEQSVASVADVIHPARFCSCFLSKVQFYYNPIYLKEAYADQQAWNQACYEEALVE